MMRTLGFRWANRGTAMFRWGEVSGGWGVGLELCHFEEYWSLHLRPIFGNLYLHLRRSTYDPVDIVDSWGFSWHWDNEMSRCIHLSWGIRTRIINLPWSWEWVYTSRLLKDGSWVYETRATQKLYRSIHEWTDWRKDERLWRETYPYRYVLRNGVVQDRMGTVTVDEMEWRWRWLQRFPFPRMRRRSINVEFDGEVGEETGSWKGGTIGCGYDLQPSETPLACLRRMEAERRF